MMGRWEGDLPGHVEHKAHGHDEIGKQNATRKEGTARRSVTKSRFTGARSCLLGDGEPSEFFGECACEECASQVGAEVPEGKSLFNWHGRQRHAQLVPTSVLTNRNDTYSCMFL